MTVLSTVLAVTAAAYGNRDLYVAPVPVQQQAFLAPAQPVVYQPAAPHYVAYAPQYVAAPEPQSAGVSAGSAFVIVAAAAVAGAAVGVAMTKSGAAHQERDVAMLAVEGRANRRAVLAAAAAASAASAIPFAAMADQASDAQTEDAVAAIARKNAAKLKEEKERERSKYQKTEADIEAEQQQSKNLILGIAGVGTALSGVFIIPNLTRLAKKITSGGEDSGYATSGAKPKRGGRGKAQPAPKQKSFAEKLFSAAFAREEI